MNSTLRQKIEDMSRDLIYCPVGKAKHFTFLVDKTKIISVGWSNSYRTHPAGKKLGYRFDGIHSELDSIIRSRRPIVDLLGVTVVNIRLNIFDEFRMAYPCPKCIPLIKSLQPRNVYYTNYDGNWEVTSF